MIHTFHLPFDPYLNLEWTFRCGQVFRFEGSANGAYSGGLGQDAFSFMPVEDGWKVVCTTSEYETRRMLGLQRSGADLEDKVMEIDARLMLALTSYRGLRSLESCGLFETILSFICSANNNVPRIRKMVGELSRLSGRSIDLDGTKVALFPLPEEVASVGEAWLRERGFGYRAKSVQDTSLKLAKDSGWEERLRQMDLTDARKKLMALPGVGPKVADCILLFGLGHGEVVPMDVHMWRILSKLYRPDWLQKTCTPQTAADLGGELLSRFGQDSGWVHQFLFAEALRL